MQKQHLLPCDEPDLDLDSEFLLEDGYEDDDPYPSMLGSSIFL